MEGLCYILATASPRRIELFAGVVEDFEVVPSQIEEIISVEDMPEIAAMKNALEKALDVSGRYPDSIVIGADTIVVLDNIVMGKPSSQSESPHS